MEQIEVMSEEAWSSLSDMYASKEDNDFFALLLSGCSSPTDLSLNGTTTTGFWASDQETSEFCNSNECHVSQEASLSPDDGQGQSQSDLYLGGTFFHSDNVPESFLNRGKRSPTGDFHYDFSPSMGNLYTGVPNNGRYLFDKYDLSESRRFEKQALDQSIEVTFPNPPERKKRFRNAADVTRSNKYMKSDESQKSNVSENEINKTVTITTSPVSVLTQEDECIKKETHINGTKRASSGKGKTSKGSSSDPQSLYARKRRERINQRLRILQGLVPNGTKVDISTMLEEAVHYVKFLQLQIKLLSSDETWMYAPLAYNGMDIGISNFDTTSPT